MHEALMMPSAKRPAEMSRKEEPVSSEKPQDVPGKILEAPASPYQEDVSGDESSRMIVVRGEEDLEKIRKIEAMLGVKLPQAIGEKEAVIDAHGQAAHNEAGTVTGEKTGNEARIEKIAPDFESDPTLVLFERMNNPVIQGQMADLLLQNDEYKATEKVEKWADKTDADGNIVYTEYDMPVQESIGLQPRYPGYRKRTREEVMEEIQERVKAITHVGGDKNIVYLYPEGSPDLAQNAYHDVYDEVYIDPSEKMSDADRSSPLEVATALAHEKGHQLRLYGKGEETFLDQTFRGLIDWDGIEMTPEEIAKLETRNQRTYTALQASSSIKEYLGACEIVERMSQLKNYFGFKGDETFTHEHLQYAREHYIQDVFDNDMSVFFRAITPEKEAKFIEAMNTYGV